MSILGHYRETERQLKELELDLSKLRENDQLKHELSFVEKFNSLISEYDFSMSKALQLISPEKVQLPAKSNRAERRVTTYINPHTNERLDTRSGNNLVLRAWKKQYGQDVVKAWKQ